MSAAKLPEDLIRPAARRLADLNEGETGYVIPWDLEVDLERRCYLNPRAALFDRASMLIEVSRRSDGYHVTVISKLPSWTPTANISAELDSSPVDHEEARSGSRPRREDRGPQREGQASRLKYGPEQGELQHLNSVDGVETVDVVSG